MSNLKKLQIAALGTTEYSTLPGKNCSFDLDKGKDDVSTFANTGSDGIKSYQSNLIYGTISSNAIWTGQQGYKAKLKKSGTPILVTDIAMELVAGETKIYKATNPLQNVWEINNSLIVKADGAAISGTLEWIDFLHGLIKFTNAPNAATAITVEAKVLPLIDLCNAREFTLGLKNEPEEDDSFCTAQTANGHTSFTSGFKEVSLEMKSFYRGNQEDIDLHDLLLTDTPILVELAPDGIYGSYVRGMFTLDKEGSSGDIGKQEEKSYSFSIASQESELKKSSFSWYHTTTTTLNKGIQYLLNSWSKRENVLYKWYPKGIGSAGRAGECVISDLSLSVGVKKPTEFTVNMNTSGAVTDIL